ncbi:amino acid ABC transporter permease [Pseudonocardia sp. CNS-139]|nr:amino acid ABC transporter permease [Pseudonocardia sp. CNS-139]
MPELVYAVVLASVYLLFALGLSICWGTIDVLNFAHGSVFLFSAYAVHLVIEQVRLPLAAMVLAGAAVGAALSVLVHYLAFEPIRRRALRRDREMQMLIVGVGIAAIPVAVVNHATAGNPFGFDTSSFDLGVHRILSVPVTSVQLLIVAVATVTTVVVAAWLRWSRRGLALRAIGVDDETALMMGVDRARLAVLTMAFSGALAGVAGVMLTLSFGALTPISGEFLIIKAFAVIIVGGVGSVVGVAVGALILATAETLLLTFTSGSWVDAVSFGMIFVLLLLRPAGLLARRKAVRT